MRAVIAREGKLNVDDAEATEKLTENARKTLQR